MKCIKLLIETRVVWEFFFFSKGEFLNRGIAPHAIESRAPYWSNYFVLNGSMLASVIGCVFVGRTPRVVCELYGCVSYVLKNMY